MTDGRSQSTAQDRTASGHNAMQRALRAQLHTTHGWPHARARHTRDGGGRVGVLRHTSDGPSCDSWSTSGRTCCKPGGSLAGRNPSCVCTAGCIVASSSATSGPGGATQMPRPRRESSPKIARSRLVTMATTDFRKRPRLNGVGSLSSASLPPPRIGAGPKSIRRRVPARPRPPKL